MRKHNVNTGLVVFWVKLRQKSYTRSLTSLWRVLKRRDLAPIKPPNPKYIPKPYEKMSYPGQRVQIEVKFVPDTKNQLKTVQKNLRIILHIWIMRRFFVYSFIGY